ncbi:MAG: hypothetical protein AAFO57_00660 [Pseudomonadota bacterium]
MSEAASADPGSRSLRETLAEFAQPKTAMMLVLGFAAGLPFLLYFAVLSYWLEADGIDVAIIGFFSWFGLSYSFKFFWAPMVDKVDPPGLAKIFGRRRAWIFTAQIGLVLSMMGIGFSDPTQNLALTALFSFLLVFSSATQDIGIDAWRIEAANTDEEQASLAAAYQYGYKVGMVISGGVTLVIAGFSSFNVAYFSMAATMVMVALVFAVWDRAKGLETAGAAGVMLVAVGVATAFGELAGITEGTILKAIFTGVSWIFYAITAAGGAAFLYFLSLALRDRPDEEVFSMSGLTLGIGFALAAYVGLALVASGLGIGIPRLAAALDFTPNRREIASYAAYVAAAPMIIFAIAIPLVRMLPADSPHLKHPAYGAFVDFFWRNGWTALLIMLFVSTYRLSDIVMGIMAKPAYSAMGYGPADVGIVSGTYGPWIVFIGVALAGISALRFGLRTSLVIGAIVSLLGNVIFAWLVLQSPDSLLPLFIAVTADNIAGGYAGTIFIAFMSTLVNKAFAGTQYAIFSSVWSLGPKLIAGTSGVLVLLFSGPLQAGFGEFVSLQSWGGVTAALATTATLEGYSNFFLAAAALGLPAIILSFFAGMMSPDRQVARTNPAEIGQAAR